MKTYYKEWRERKKKKKKKKKRGAIAHPIKQIKNKWLLIVDYQADEL